MKVESFFPGRLRVRSALFTRQESLTRLGEIVGTIQGVKNIFANPKTGSVTVVYDPNLISTQMLMEARGRMEELAREFSHSAD